MKFLIALSLLVGLATGQNPANPDRVKKDLQTVNTAEQAQSYLSKSGLKGKVMELDEIRDSSAAALRLYKTRTGEVSEQLSPDKSTTYLYKTLTIKEPEADRVQYIFFDNGKVTKKRIDSLRSVIMKKINGGETFAALAKQYSMDRSGQRGGDTGWYDRETFMPGFVSAVRSHAKGDVFVVDLPAQKWYYVVRKSHEPLKRKKVTALYVAVPVK